MVVLDGGPQLVRVGYMDAEEQRNRITCRGGNPISTRHVGKPGHCINDIAFPVFLNSYENSVDIYPIVQPSFFTVLISGEMNSNKQWCWHLLDKVGLIDTSAYNKRTLPLFPKTVCYHKLLMPLCQVHRFPIDWADPRAQADLMAGGGVRGHLSMKKYDTSADGSSEVLYPALAFEKVRQCIFQNNPGFSDEPWSEVVEDGIGDAPILLYGRHNTGRRIWIIEERVKHFLEQHYRVSIKVIDNEWNSLTPSQQALIFHNYSRIVAPHGAHFANLVYCRKNTRIVEIVLGFTTPAPVLNMTKEEKDDNSRPLSDWYGQHTWFSWARRMGLHHFAIGEPSAKGFDAKSFNATEEIIIPFLVHRLALRPRLEK